MTAQDATGRQDRDTGRPLYRDHNLQILFSITLMAVMGVSSISPLLPDVAKALDVSDNQIGLLVTAFTLPGIVLTPVLGILSDRIGRKTVLVPSLFLFGIAGTAVAFSQSFETMVALRFLQGMGGASLGTINVTMIGDMYSGRERTEAMGFNSSVLSMGTGTYPTIGGFLAIFGWRYPFLLPALAIPIGLLVLFSLHNPEPAGSRSLRAYAGEVLKSLNSRLVVGLLAATFTTFVILYGARVTYLPILMEDVFDASPLVVGLILSSSPVATGITAWQLGRITRRVPERRLIGIAFVLYAVAVALIPMVPNLYLLLIPSFLFGVAQGINLPNVFSLLTGSVNAENRGALLALNGMVLRTGQTVGPLVMASMVASASLLDAFYLLALVPLVMAVIAVFTIAR